jgi:hypothetical protein
MSIEFCLEEGKNVRFAFGFCIGPSGKYERYARPALDQFHPGAQIYERRNQSSIFEAYNSIMDEHRAEGAGSPLILMHEDVEIRDVLTPAITRAFSDPEVAILGTIGGRGLRSVRWFRSEERFGRAPDIVNGENLFSTGVHNVDTVDGLFMALSPWASENLRFDDRNFDGFHGYDADICMQARAAGKTVRVENLDLFHHSKGGFGDARSHRKTDDVFRKKWGIPHDPLLYRWRKKLRNRAF